MRSCAEHYVHHMTCTSRIDTHFRVEMSWCLVVAVSAVGIHRYGGESGRWGRFGMVGHSHCFMYCAHQEENFVSCTLLFICTCVYVSV